MNGFGTNRSDRSVGENYGKTPLKTSRKMDETGRDEIHQKLYREKLASDDLHDPNSGIPYVHCCILRRHAQRIEHSVWCIHVGQGHNKHNQTIEAPNNRETVE